MVSIVRVLPVPAVVFAFKVLFAAHGLVEKALEARGQQLKN